MTERIHVTVSGHRIAYEPSPKVVTFLRRLAEMVTDGSVSENEFVGLAYSKENPILDHAMFPTRGAVTKDVLADPAYAVLTDLLFRKRLAISGEDVSKIAARYTMTVSEAAAELGIHESAVRQAIAAKRLPSWISDGKHYIDPRSLKDFETGTRGPKRGTTIERSVSDSIDVSDSVDATLAVVMGHGDGSSMKVRSRESMTDLEPIAGNLLRARLKHWEKVVVKTTAQRGKLRRAFVLTRGPDENELVHGRYSIRGRFRVSEKANANAAADKLWDETEIS